MSKLEEKLIKLGYKQPYNKSYFCKTSKEKILIKVFVNYNISLIECFEVGNDHCYTYSKEEAENLVKAWNIVEEDLKELSTFMEGVKYND